MRSASGKWCRQPLNTISVRPIATRKFSTTAVKHQIDVNANPNHQYEPSQRPSAGSDDTYLNVQIDSENKTIKTVVGDLPLSPLMDPAFHEARQRWTRPKPTSTDYKPTKFQNQLARNPYARALATPIRRCPVTGTTLPNFFLLRIGLAAHPETNTPYFVPRDLEARVLPDDADTEDKVLGDGQAEADPGPSSQDSGEPLGTEDFTKEFLAAEDSPGKEPPDVLPGAQNTTTPSKSKKSATPTGPASYILSRQKLLHDLQEPNSAYYRGHKKLFRMSDHGPKQLGAVLNEAVWRSDMDVVLLDMLRRRAVEGLCRTAQAVETQGREYLTKCELWTDAKHLKHKGCLLYLGPPEGTSPGLFPEIIPPILSTVYLGPSRYMQTIPVHNLRELLGEERLSHLRRKSQLFRDGSLFMLGREATVSLQLVLWKLQGYLLHDKPKDTEETGSPSEKPPRGRMISEEDGTAASSTAP